MYFRTGYRPTSSRGSGAGAGVADAVSIGGVADVETSSTDAVLAAGVADAGTSGVGLVSAADVSGAGTSGSDVISSVNIAGVETSGGELDFFGCLTWANWTCLTWADNESKEPVNVCDTKSQGTAKIRSVINPHANIVPIIRGTGFVDRGCGKGCTCIGNGGKGNTLTSFRLWLSTLSFFTRISPNQRVIHL